MMAGMIFFRNRSPTNFNCLRALRTDGCSNNGLSLSLTGFIAFSTFSWYFSSYVFFISYLKRAHFSSFGGGCDLRDSLDVDVRVVRALLTDSPSDAPTVNALTVPPRLKYPN